MKISSTRAIQSAFQDAVTKGRITTTAGESATCQGYREETLCKLIEQVRMRKASSPSKEHHCSIASVAASPKC